MRRGCISLGQIQCDKCQRVIPHSERYVVVGEEDGVEVEQGKASCYCLDCCLVKGYAEYREEKGERVLTFFPAESQPSQQGSDESSSKVE